MSEGNESSTVSKLSLSLDGPPGAGDKDHKYQEPRAAREGRGPGTPRSGGGAAAPASCGVSRTSPRRAPLPEPLGGAPPAPSWPAPQGGGPRPPVTRRPGAAPPAEQPDRASSAQGRLPPTPAPDCGLSRVQDGAQGTDVPILWLPDELLGKLTEPAFLNPPLMERRGALLCCGRGHLAARPPGPAAGRPSMQPLSVRWLRSRIAGGRARRRHRGSRSPVSTLAHRQEVAWLRCGSHCRTPERRALQPDQDRQAPRG